MIINILNKHIRKTQHERQKESLINYEGKKWVV